MMGSPGSPRRPSSILPNPAEQGGILRRRISSMFLSDADTGSPRPAFALDPDVTKPEPEPFKDRNAIKVKIITWNMADSIPKGDLSVLLGEIPESAYDVPAKGDEIPELALENSHPYHIVVFAAQECPSASGMPRGIGGSLMKGVGLQKSEAARRERDDKKGEHDEKRRQEKETEKVAKKAIREIRKEFLERTTAEKDALQAIKGLRREFKEREGSPANLKDIIGKDKDTTEKEKDVSGLGSNVSTAADDISVKSKTVVTAESSSDGDSSSSEETHTNSRADSVNERSLTSGSEGISAADQGHLASSPASTTAISPGGVAAVPSPEAVRLAASPPAAVRPSNDVVGPDVTDSLREDMAIASSNGDCLYSASEPAEPKPAPDSKGCIGEPAPSPASQAPNPPAKDKSSREQLRIDTQYKRKSDPKDTLSGARSLPAFDIGLGSPMTDRAGAMGRKGWSHMLEEWFCAGPPNPCRDLSPVPSPPMDESDMGTQRISGEYLSPSIASQTAPSRRRAWSMSHKRSSSLRSTTRPTIIGQDVQIPVPGANGILATPSVPFGRPLSGQSIQSLDTVASSLLASQEDRRLGRPSGVREMGRSPVVFDSPTMDDPPFKRSCRQPGGGPYVQLIKERLMGLYVHVFVYKGCEHLVEGVDKDFVRTGLAGGRIGNKGGIGISLNLKGHRLLFVNAHLAAHAECNDDRIANINKIKSELRPNCFLPQDDPRTSMQDITDRFDTTFWCGDLNFRVDISHLHSKWLLKEHRYITVAQEWDQLKMIMNDPKKNPLVGFEEAEITFMPTFKYDIWKSVNATNRDKRSTNVGFPKRSGTTLKAKTQRFINIMRLGRKPTVRSVPRTLSDDASRRSSVSSLRSRGVSESRLSIMSDDQSSRPGAGAGSPHISGASFDSDLVSPAPGTILPDGDTMHRTSSQQSTISVSGLKLASPPRRPRGLIQSFSGRDLTEDLEEEEACTTDTRTGVYDTSKKGRIPSWCDRVLWKTHVIPDAIEDPAADSGDDESVASNGPLMRLSNVFSTLSGRMRRRSSFYGDVDQPRALFSRMANSTSAPYGLVGAIPDNHHIAPVERIAGVTLAPNKSVLPDQPIPSWHATPISQDEEVFESDPPTPADGEVPTNESPEQLNGILPVPPLPAHIRSLSTPRKRGLSVAFEQPPVSAQSLRRDMFPTAEAIDLPALLSQNSIGFGPSPLSHRLSHGRRASGATDSMSSRNQSLSRRLSMSSIGSIGSSASRTRRRSEDVSYLRDSNSTQLHPLKAVRSTGQLDPRSHPHRGSDGGLDAPYVGLNALTRFFRGLPGRFHSRVSLFPGSEAEVEEAVSEVPRRHLAGEVQVLHYGTLEDAEMRRLEGRSDHYPLIFSAAVFI
ncbi:hypothetical protein CspeluHIS016_0204470 [Cutaneotrichosporon spelunceum]|uniref:Inositol polyphosphate-related phosphatase domain-containing protein n=1 Tax=Cutaneotrichosporon spelunceum TaxID=1672016 RepID=A0AAD3TR40_9TREE|nr:hypothetical protein CspeluHIS016_0204470 [Cutaneotrichosporon spelunceum]